MSEQVIVLENEKDVLAGMFVFDGTVLELFGFREVHSMRFHVRQIERVEVSFKSGLMSSPQIRIVGRAGSTGYVRAIEPAEEIKPELEKLADAVNAAASRWGVSQ